MRIDYTIFLICIALVIIKFFIKFIEINSIRCCGDCLSYEKCWNKNYNKNCYETPMCNKFRERK